MTGEKRSEIGGAEQKSICVVEGDCINVLKNLPDGFINFVLTDPPYLCDYTERSGRRILNDASDSWLRPAFEQVGRVLADDSYCFSFYGWSHVDFFMQAWRAAGLRPVAHFAFVKPYPSSQSFVARHHEVAFLLVKGKPKQPTRKIKDVIEWKYTGNKLHPTQKPLDILRSLIEAYSNQGDYVLDPFCGSASTLIAAHQLNRAALGVELDPKFAEIATRRVQEHLKRTSDGASNVADA